MNSCKSVRVVPAGDKKNRKKFVRVVYNFKGR
jgi:hypothetical protein